MIETFYKNNYRMCVKRIAYRTGQLADAEDVVHDAFERAMKYKRFAPKGEEEFASWFNTVLNNAYKNWRSENRMQGMTIEYDEKKDTPVPMPETSDMKLVRRKIKNKRGGLRQVLHLYFICGLHAREIAQIVDMSPGVIRLSVHRFKKEMQEKV